MYLFILSMCVFSAQINEYGLFLYVNEPPFTQQHRVFRMDDYDDYDDDDLPSYLGGGSPSRTRITYPRPYDDEDEYVDLNPDAWDQIEVDEAKKREEAKEREEEAARALADNSIVYLPEFTQPPSSLPPSGPSPYILSGRRFDPSASSLSSSVSQPPAEILQPPSMLYYDDDDDNPPVPMGDLGQGRPLTDPEQIALSAVYELVAFTAVDLQITQRRTLLGHRLFITGLVDLCTSTESVFSRLSHNLGSLFFRVGELFDRHVRGLSDENDRVAIRRSLPFYIVMAILVPYVRGHVQNNTLFVTGTRNFTQGVREWLERTMVLGYQLGGWFNAMWARNQPDIESRRKAIRAAPGVNPTISKLLLEVVKKIYAWFTGPGVDHEVNHALSLNALDRLSSAFGTAFIPGYDVTQPVRTTNEDRQFDAALPAMVVRGLELRLNDPALRPSQTILNEYPRVARSSSSAPVSNPPLMSPPRPAVSAPSPTLTVPSASSVSSSSSSSMYRPLMPLAHGIAKPPSKHVSDPREFPGYTQFEPVPSMAQRPRGDHRSVEDIYDETLVQLRHEFGNASVFAGTEWYTEVADIIRRLDYLRKVLSMDKRAFLPNDIRFVRWMLNIMEEIKKKTKRPRQKRPSSSASASASSSASQIPSAPPSAKRITVQPSSARKHYTNVIADLRKLMDFISQRGPSSSAITIFMSDIQEQIDMDRGILEDETDPEERDSLYVAMIVDMKRRLAELESEYEKSIGSKPARDTVDADKSLCAYGLCDQTHDDNVTCKHCRKARYCCLAHGIADHLSIHRAECTS